MRIVLELTEKVMKDAKLSDFIAAHEPNIVFFLTVACGKCCEESVSIPAVITAVKGHLD